MSCSASIIPLISRARGDAERFFSLFPSRDWSADDIYRLPDPDGYRDGYSTVTRFFHRVAILFEERQLDRSLARKLFARETGYWFAVIYELMAQRTGMFTRDAIFRLVKAMRTGAGETRFTEGYAQGLKRRGRTGARRWVRLEKRWSKKGAPLS